MCIIVTICMHIPVPAVLQFTLADANYVVMFVHTVMVMDKAVAAPEPQNTAATKPRDMVHLFRLEQGKVVEHWDITTASS